MHTFYANVLIFAVHLTCANCLPTASLSERLYTDRAVKSEEWKLTQRTVNSTDTIIPADCHVSCKDAFNATNSSASSCICECPNEMPVFLQDRHKCVKRFEGCPKQLQFSSANSLDSVWTPLLSFPQNRSAIGGNQRLLWKESAVKVRAGSGAKCNITQVSYMLNEWMQASVDLFKIGWANNDAKIMWTGSEEDAEALAGSIVLISLDCLGSADRNAHCVTFRVPGAIEMSPVVQSNVAASATGRFETILIILLSILLFLSVFGSVILWNICWRLKKSEIISTVQMQMLYCMKTAEQEKAAMEAQRAHAFNNGDDVEGGREKSEKDEPDGNPSQNNQQSGAPTKNVVTKRKLYFSTEFLEPQHMENPPPMAQQFLHEIRQMIDIQRQRIQMRRHQPHLSSIPEEAVDHYRPYMEMEEKEREKQAAVEELARICTKTLAPSRSGNLEESCESSPKSTKSMDSGRESMGSQHERDRSSSPKTRRKREVVEEPADDDESLDTPPAETSRSGNNTTINSRIPISANGLTKSPRLPTKGLLTTAKPLMRPERINVPDVPPLPKTPPPLPPRNIPQATRLHATANGTSTSLPLPINGRQPSSDSPRNTPTTVRNARRKAYAVFPTDSMLKKSLPRRSKKQISTNGRTSPGVIETNM